MTADSIKPHTSADRTRETDGEATKGLPHVDRLALLGDRTTRPQSVKAPEPAELQMTDAFKKAGASLASRRAESPARDIEAVHTLPSFDAVAAKVPESGAKQSSKNSTFSPSDVKVLSAPDHPDPSKRNALVLDYFDNRATALHQESHGEFIDKGLRTDNFNVFTATPGNEELAGTSGHADFGRLFDAVNAKVDSGELPLKQGDIVTASFGDIAKKDGNGGVKGGDPTFKEASDLLKMNLNPSNIKENTPEIIRRLGLVADGKDPQSGLPTPTDANKMEQARFALHTDEAIKKLQEKGISVVHAAGNDGPEKVSLGFLAAKFRLSSNRPDGQPDAFSAHDDATKPANGVLPIRAISPGRFNDPTPFDQQKELLQIGDTGRVRAAPPGPLPSYEFHREKLGTDTKHALSPIDPGSEIGKVASGRFQASAGIQFLDDSPPKPSDPSKFPTIGDESLPGKFPEPRPRIVGYNAGTSYSVIDFMKGRADRNIPFPAEEKDRLGSH